MADNLLDMLKSQVGNAALGQLSQYLGVGQDKTGSILEKAGAAMLGGMMQKASSPAGLGDLFNMIQKQGGSGIPDLGAILGSPQKRDEYVRGGEDIAGSILGGNLGQVVSALGPLLGVGANLIKPLLGMIAPMLIGLISKQLTSGGGFSANGLMDLLMSQKSNVQAALPANFGSALGLASLGDLGKGAASHVADAARSAANYGAEAARTVGQAGQAAAAEGSSLLNTLLPLIGLALLALLGLFALRQCAPPEEAPVEPAARTDADRDVVIDRETTIKPAPRPLEPGKVAPLPGPGEEIKDAVDATGDALKRATDATGDALKDAGAGLRDAAGDAGRAVENAADNAGRAVRDAADNAGRAVENVGSEIRDAAGRVTEPNK